MMIVFSILLLIYLDLFGAVPVYNQPEQIHLSINHDPTNMVVTWVTLSWLNASYAAIGTNKYQLNTKVQSKDDIFKDGGSEKRSLYMHRATFTGLSPSTTYFYRVGSRFGWSSVFSFTTFPPENSNWTPRFIVFGDMGNKNAQCMEAMQVETEKGMYDMMIHVGDFAYNMDLDNARIGDQFMRQIQPIATRIPYMTIVGNHESAYNFSNYRRRFTMPGGDGEGQFYSFNLGKIHFLVFDTEYYYYLEYGKKQIENQYYWLENDLKEATKPENRAKRPWIIAMGHKPMYCSNNNDPVHCERINNIIRVGINLSGKSGGVSVFGLENLFYKYGVDLIYGAHEHSYERMWPVYNNKVCNGTHAPYTDPQAPVHIITGSAGNVGGQDTFYVTSPVWSAMHTTDFGYTRMQVPNSTHLFIQQVSHDQNGRVIDQMTYIRNKHGPFTKC